MAPIQRFRRYRRWLAYLLLALAMLVSLTFGRPGAHLLRTAWRDYDVLKPLPVGAVDDASRMNETLVSQIIDAPPDRAAAEQQLIDLVTRAGANRWRIAIAGARHTMGGHSIYPGGIALNMQSFNRFELDESSDVLHVQAGARWDQIIPYLDLRGRSIEIMQSNNSFTVGGSLSANCHGWQPNRPPIASTVHSFRLLKADGEIVTCSRQENAELFSLVLGGYGLFGVILDVDLKVTKNRAYQCGRVIVSSDQLAQAFSEHVIGRPQVGLAYARLCAAPDQFLSQAVLNTFSDATTSNLATPALHEASWTGMKRAVFRGSVGSDYGKQLRWDAELFFSDHLTDVLISRNQLLSDPVSLYQNRSDQSTDIIHEYFLPPGSLGDFIRRMQEIIPAHRGDLLNVTVRHVLEDTDTFLRYADRDMLAVVLLFDQERSVAGDQRMQAMTQELIDAALDLQGRYYLPYRLHASPAQFARAYPQAKAFFELKRKYDPHEIFQNQFYVKYAGANSD